MSSVPADPHWQVEFDKWLAPFLSALGHRSRRRWAPVYLKGLLSAPARRCATTMARSLAPGEKEQLHHFVAASPWGTEPLESVLVEQANRLVGGEGAHLIIDDTALRKKGRHSVGVARQWCGESGKLDNCQALVSTTLARGETPVCIGLRLFLPEEWIVDRPRRKRAKIPSALVFRTKWQIALEEIDRVMAAGAEFSDVLADAGYGVSAEFRKGLSERRLLWAVGIGSTQKVFPADVRVRMPGQRPEGGRPAKHPVPSKASVSAQRMIDSLGRPAFRALSWRRGVKGPLRARFAAVRVRVADGRKVSRSQHLPGDAAWLVCEWRKSGEKKYYLSNAPESASRAALARMIKGRWVCEQPHQQMKQELGLDHFEGRSWTGLRHHCVLTMIAFCFLQHLRLNGKKKR